jgi:cysteine desulfurase
VAPTSPAAREALLAALDDGWADPERLHREGRTARMLLDGAREAVAAALGARTEEVGLTGSHTAAVHAAVLGTLLGRRRAGDRLVHSAVEHSAVLACASWHASTADGSPVAVPVDLHARVDLDRFVAEVAQPGTAVAALQSANGEVGTRQPVVEVLDACRAAGVPLVVDAAASAGHEPLPPADVMVADPRAWGAPPGTGVLVVRAGVRWRSPWPEDAAVPGDRAGVPGGAGVPQALAAAVGLQAALAERDAADARRREVVALLRERLPALVRDVEVVGDPDDRLPHVLTFSCLYADGESLLGELDAAGFAVGSGSACTASTLEPSHVLAAMGALTHGNVRVGLPATTDGPTLHEHAERFLAVLPAAVARVRDRLGTSGL